MAAKVNRQAGAQRALSRATGALTTVASPIMQTGKPEVSQKPKAGTRSNLSQGRRCPACPFYAPSGKCLDQTIRSGRCGDWIWYLRKGKQIRRLWSRPRDPRTPRQRQCRARLAAASKRYSHGLSDGQQEACIAAGARLRSRPRLCQSGPLTGQQYWVRQECSPRAAVGPRSVSTVENPCKHRGFPHQHGSAAVVVPVCNRGRAEEGRPFRAEFEDWARPGSLPGRAKLPERVPTGAVARRLRTPGL